MALPKTGITTSLVANTLGSSSRNVGALCTNSNINMWSRMKPVHIANAVSVDRNGMWWKGTFGDCGISLENARTNNYHEIKAKYDTYADNGWEYSPPKSPYRLGDFTEYKHDATSPIYSMWVPAEVAKDGLLSVSFAHGMTESDKTGAGSVRFDDITPISAIGNLNNYYVGIIVYDGNIFKGRVTATNTGVGAQVQFNTNGLYIGYSYQVYPFLSQYKMAQSSADVMNEYYTLPSVKSGKFKIVSAADAAGISIFLTADTIYDNGQKNAISYSVKINSKTNVTLTNNHIQMRFSNKEPNDPFMMGEQSQSLGSISLSANGTKEFSGTFYINEPLKSYYIYITLQTGRYTQKVFAMERPQIK